jgi:hypothetical protein
VSPHNRSITYKIFCPRKIPEKNGSTMRQYISYSYTSRKSHSVRKEVLYNILIEFGVPMKLIRLIKMYLNETYSKLHIGKHLSDSFLPKMI